MLKHGFAALATMTLVWLVGPGQVAPVHAGAGKLRFEIYQDAKMEYRWRLKDGDDKVLATGGQSFSAKGVAIKGAERIKSLGKQKFEVYQDKGKEYRWKLVATNGQTIAVSGGSYTAAADAEKAIATIKKGAPKAEVVEVKAEKK